MCRYKHRLVILDTENGLRLERVEGELVVFGRLSGEIMILFARLSGEKSDLICKALWRNNELICVHDPINLDSNTLLALSVQ